MALRWEIKDRQNPTNRGMRFSTLERARRELAHAVPPSRWFISDRSKILNELEVARLHEEPTS